MARSMLLMKLSYLAAALTCAGAFSVTPLHSLTRLSSQCSFSFLKASALEEAVSAEPETILVISPPGGVGEAAATQAAAVGHNVQWFLVRDENEGVSIPSSVAQTWKGNLNVAGGRVEDLLKGSSDSIKTWIGSFPSNPSAVIAAYDWEDVSSASTRREYQRQAMSNSDLKVDSIQAKLEAAIRVVVKESMSALPGSGNSITKVAILPEDVELEEDDSNDDGKSEGSGLFGSIFGGGNSVPSSLLSAFGSSNVRQVRVGELFGLPASSPDFSPLVGGPKREAELAEELVQQGIRLDAFIAGARLSESTCSRPTAGLGAVLLATGGISGLNDILLSSQPDTAPQPLEIWKEELARAKSNAEKVASSSPVVFEQLNLKVKDTIRLADWLTTKWAPAVLRTYDLASIRTGARPVYAQKGADNESVLVWQELVDMRTKTVASMRISVTEDGVTAMRESKTRKPLPGEQVLVRRLQEGLVQAVEKGLATKVKSKAVKAVKKQEPVSVAVSSVQDAGTVTAAAAAPSADGPRTAGVRRSTPRKRRSSKPSE